MNTVPVTGENAQKEDPFIQKMGTQTDERKHCCARRKTGEHVWFSTYLQRQYARGNRRGKEQFLNGKKAGKKRNPPGAKERVTNSMFRKKDCNKQCEKAQGALVQKGEREEGQTHRSSREGGGAKTPGKKKTTTVGKKNTMGERLTGQKRKWVRNRKTGTLNARTRIPTGETRASTPKRQYKQAGTKETKPVSNMY